MTKGIIFDFNGTMFFDSRENEAAWQEFILDLRGESISDQDFQNHIHGRSNESALEYLLQRSITPEELGRYTKQKETLYRTLCLKNKERLHLVDGLPELLDQLVEMNIPIAIATSAEKSNLDFYLHHFNLLHWFNLDKIIYNDGTFPCKPDPTIYLKATKALNLSPPDCIVIEDSPSGIKAAKAADIGKIIRIASPEDFAFLQNLSEVDSVITDFKNFDLSWIGSSK